MKEDPKTACINFRISSKYKEWLEELVFEEGKTSFSDYFNWLILMRKIESIIKKLIKDAKNRVVDEYKFLGNISDKIQSPCDIEGVYPEEVYPGIEKKIKDRWMEEFKNLFTTEFGLVDGIEDLSHKWPQIANFTSDYSVIKILTFLLSQKSEKFRNLTQSGGV